MSDTTDTTAAPAAPVEESPAPQESPSALAAPTPETSAAVAADPASAPATDAPEPAAEPAPDETESEPEEAPAPQVVNDENGQRVIMPDGSTVYTRHDSLPRSNAEQATFELTHSGDQLRYPYVPGDKEYNAYSDPAVPNSHLARMVETEIVSFGERVLADPKAAVSTMWNALKGVFDGELKQAIETGEGSGKIVEV